MTVSEEEVRRLVETVHALLRSPAEGNEDGAAIETERIALDIPKAWVVLAAWLAMRERLRRAGDHATSAFMRPDSPDHVDKHIRTWARRLLWKVIDHQMHLDLHELAVGSHPYLFPEEQAEPTSPEPDDGIPF